MADGHGKSIWAPASILMMMYANVHRDPKAQRAFTVKDFNPYADRGTGAKPEPVIRMKDLSILKSVFVTKQKGSIAK